MAKTSRLTEDTNADTTESDSKPRAAVLDRSRAQIRLPDELVKESLRIAYNATLSDQAVRTLNPAPPDPDVVLRLTDGGIMTRDGMIEPVAAELLRTINNASLMVSIDLRCGPDSSTVTVWATPRQAVVSSSLEPGCVEFRPVQVSQLPYLLSDLVVLQSPRYIAPAPIAVRTAALAEAEAARDDYDDAFHILTNGGLIPDHAELVLAFQAESVRRWRISSTWSTDEGKEKAELRGLDAGDNGQWLLTMTGSSEQGQMGFEPQGHGDMAKAFRSVLPRNWIGTPLNPPSS